jgi:hypothetical protein
MMNGRYHMTKTLGTRSPTGQLKPPRKLLKKAERFLGYTAKNQYRKLETNIPRKGIAWPNFHIHVSESDLYIPTIDLPILLQEICGPILGIYM